MAKVYISLGSNIEPLHNIRAGLRDLKTRYGDLELSSVYESEAVGFTGDNFYNLIAVFESEEDPHTINDILHDIEQAHGRERNSARFSSRTLDMDLILYGDRVLNEDKLKLPRDEVLKYAFVLRPLAEVAPEVCHPLTSQCYADLWQRFDQHKQPLWPVDVNVMP